MSNKYILRMELKKNLKLLSPKRRYDVAFTLVEKLKKLQGPVLSFAPFAAEIDLWPLNRYLAAHSCLVLPKVEGKQLAFYQVTDLERQLIRSSWGVLEPIVSKTKAIRGEKIVTALIPGLGFDANHHRLGYGKGFYDRAIPLLVDATTIGVGFKEQKLDTLIDAEEHDVVLDQLCYC